MNKVKNHSVEQTAQAELVIARVFDAPRTVVFDAWTNPNHAKHWWAPRGFTCPSCRIDLRPGGAYLHCMRSPQGRDYWSKGTYREVAEPHRVVCVDTFADENGHTVSPEYYGMSSEWPNESIITVAFTEQHPGKTEVTVTCSPVGPSPERQMCEQGWRESLEKLADYLAARTS